MKTPIIGRYGERSEAIIGTARALSLFGLLTAAGTICAGTAQAAVYETIASNYDVVTLNTGRYDGNVGASSISRALPVTISDGDGLDGGVAESLNGPPLVFAAAQSKAGSLYESRYPTGALATAGITYYLEVTSSNPGIFPLQFNEIGSGGGTNGTIRISGPIYSESGTLFQPLVSLPSNFNISGVADLYYNTAYTIQLSVSASAGCPYEGPYWVCPAESASVALDPTIGSVPEPGTWALLLTGLGFMGLLSHRRAGRRRPVALLVMRACLSAGLFESRFFLDGHDSAANVADGGHGGAHEPEKASIFIGGLNRSGAHGVFYCLLGPRGIGPRGT